MSSPSVSTRDAWRGRQLVYRCYDADGRLLYVGKSHNLPDRLKTHAGDKWWWQLVARIKVRVHPTHTAALAAERAAIRDEVPAFNVRSALRGIDDRSHWTATDHRLCKKYDQDRDHREDLKVRNLVRIAEWRHDRQAS